MHQNRLKILTEFLSRFLNPIPTFENARNRSKTAENDRKRPKTFEISDTSEKCQNFRKFSSEGRAASILRGVRGAAMSRPQPRRGRRCGRAVAAPRLPPRPRRGRCRGRRRGRDERISKSTHARNLLRNSVTTNVCDHHMRSCHMACRLHVKK